MNIFFRRNFWQLTLHARHHDRCQNGQFSFFFSYCKFLIPLYGYVLLDSLRKLAFFLKTFHYMLHFFFMYFLVQQLILLFYLSIYYNKLFINDLSIISEYLLHNQPISRAFSSSSTLTSCTNKTRTWCTSVQKKRWSKYCRLWHQLAV